MEETFNTEAIILDRQAFKEVDLKLIVFSREKGRLELIARGAKKIRSKTSAHIEPITFSRLMIIKGRQYDYLGSAIGQNFYLKIKSELDRINLAGKAVKIIKELTREGEVNDFSDLFEYSMRYLQHLDKDEIVSRLSYQAFVLGFLSQIGFAPNFQDWRLSKDALCLVLSFQKYDFKEIDLQKIDEKTIKELDRAINGFIVTDLDILAKKIKIS